MAMESARDTLKRSEPGTCNSERAERRREHAREGETSGGRGREKPKGKQARPKQAREEGRERQRGRAHPRACTQDA
eukprot:2847887-Alexandrium_andersonii.AAC.1